jgi:hypothetical protein
MLAGKDLSTALDLLRKVRGLPSASPYVGPTLVMDGSCSPDLAIARLSSEFASVFPVRALCITGALSAPTLARLLQAMVQCPTLRSLSLERGVPQEIVINCLEALASPTCTVRCLDLWVRRAVYAPLHRLLTQRADWSSLRFSAADWTMKEWKEATNFLRTLRLDVIVPNHPLESLFGALVRAENLTALTCRTEALSGMETVAQLPLTRLVSLVLTSALPLLMSIELSLRSFHIGFEWV